MQRKVATRWVDRAIRTLIGSTAVFAACIALSGIGLRERDGGLRTAMEAYEAQQWPQAYAKMAAAADEGDASAARVATMMARRGPLLFGQRFDVSREQLTRWDQVMRGRTPSAR